LGFAAFFLNRTNRSGILAGGVIGGKKQTGNYGIDARFNKADLIGRIEAIGAMARSITVSCCDAKEWLTQVDLPARSLLYLDPPYYVKGGQLYRNFYEPEDHADIAKLVMMQKTPVVVTYDDVQPIRKLYAGVEAVNFSLHYSTHLQRPKSSEVMFYRNLSLPSLPQMTRGNTLSPAGPHKRGNVVPERVHELLC
jgi:DNA adenine methylase